MIQPFIVQKLISEVLSLLDPYDNMKEIIKFEDHCIKLRGNVHELRGALHFFSAGKAASYELDAILRIFEESCNYNNIGLKVAYTKDSHTVENDKIIQLEGTHPVVSEKNIEQTQLFLDYLSKVKGEDTLIFLLSGGASALLEMPQDKISFEDLKSKHKELLRSGLGISEMNEIRKSLSKVKDGKLLNFIKTKNILQLITCDIPSEKLEDVSSGPMLSSQHKDNHPFTLLGQSASLLLNNLCRDSSRIRGKIYDCSLEQMQNDLLSHLPGSNQMLISGGEAPIKLPKNSGKGGRNTHFVLSFAEIVYKNPSNRDIHIMSLGTDGGDGPTNAAGAYISYELYNSLSSRQYLEEYNSYEYFEKIGTLIKTGPTKTNVMDVRFIWRE